MNEISAQDTYLQILSGAAYGVDVREQKEWVAGHAEGVEWNPLSKFDFAVLPTDRPIIFICRSGNRSGQVTEYLAQSRDEVFNMVGGMKAWDAAGLPMIGETGAPFVA
jgi:rhodanese-related sulfurtransferase